MMMAADWSLIARAEKQPKIVAADVSNVLGNVNPIERQRHGPCGAGARRR